ncbi:YicC/YloC family endoribonuclease [Amphiplicatus metriothermophilus]|uniref:TIGR00255 family protein n=1 Tax=Amphiplicatus metriothermophilus TaxID=1519374 RepID=A0A239PXW4_9PROT|nr:YicC/YloC family endoribonuclease [Amphiplicatus metriothermophilus]MBB5519854.1 uncharacterized protein (TIGR00255 family) [Amphiplicatus metriothermophilus]SNT75095.1 TIGR00255 family protein [Amphiplicatus metriothermophilus]
MTISSMTGFARVDGAHEKTRWTWEIKSVNGRGLELRFRLPGGFDFLEPALRKAAGTYFARGWIAAGLAFERGRGAAGLRVNEAALDEAVRLVEAVRRRTDCAFPRADGVLALPGVIETDEGAGEADEREALADRLLESFRNAAEALCAARRREGESLHSALAGQIDEIEALVARARTSAEAAPAAIRERIAAQLQELLAGAPIPEERLAQEAAMLAVKADIREELDRLSAHAAAARALLASGEPVGRRLDFLTQEFNREANTLCSKAQDMGLKRIGLDLKTVIDQMREQAQNVE